MLNLLALDEDDRSTLERSFKLIEKDSEIISDQELVRVITNKTSSFLTIPNRATYSFQNLFKVRLPKGNIFIGQGLLDFGYPVKVNLMQSHTREYSLQMVGFCELSVDLGKTVLRPENKLDKFIGKFWNNGIKFDKSEKFNKKYNLVSTKKMTVKKHFDKPFVDTIANYKNVLLMTKGNAMVITFGSELQVGHSRIIQDILKNCNFIVD